LSSAGATSRRGPILARPRPSPIRRSSTGSVSTQVPSKLNSTVACPSHDTVSRSSGQVAGSGRCGAGATGPCRPRSRTARRAYRRANARRVARGKLMLYLAERTCLSSIADGAWAPEKT